MQQDKQKRTAVYVAFIVIALLVLAPTISAARGDILKTAGVPGVQDMNKITRPGNDPAGTLVKSAIDEKIAEMKEKITKIDIETEKKGSVDRLQAMKQGIRSRGVQAPLKGVRIVLDPGHGGANPGAVGVNGSREADNVLQTSLKLRRLLEEAGAEVIMTRSTRADVRLPGQPGVSQLRVRTVIANKSGADLFISIHNNSNPDPKVSGAMTFYKRGSTQSRAVARTVQREMVRATGARNLGTMDAGYYVLRNNRLPALLVETGFVTNAREEKRLVDPTYQEKIARGIYQGIVKYFHQQNKTK